MARLSAAERASRNAFDFQVVSAMSGTTWTATAYATTHDLERRARAVTREQDGARASKYLVSFAVPTLIGPGRFAETTVVGFDTDVGDYPYSEPLTWIACDHVPYSPHFRKGSPVCIGPLWRAAEGRMLLGQLFNHVARMLNWDERLEPGYGGWNPAAVAYHRRHYGRPLNPGLRYPPLPVGITHPGAGAEAVEALCEFGR